MRLRLLFTDTKTSENQSTHCTGSSTLHLAFGLQSTTIFSICSVLADVTPKCSNICIVALKFAFICESKSCCHSEYFQFEEDSIQFKLVSHQQTLNLEIQFCDQQCSVTQEDMIQTLADSWAACFPPPLSQSWSVPQDYPPSTAQDNLLAMCIKYPRQCSIPGTLNEGRGVGG